MAEPTSVVIADDDAAIRDVLQELIADEPDLALAGSADGVEGAIDLCERLRPDVALLDYRMPDGGGRRVIEEIHARGLATRIVLLSSDDSTSSVREMLRLGASGYVVKGSAAEEIVDAVRRAARGQLSLSMAMASTALGELVHDADELARTAARLRESEQRFGLLLDAARVAVALFDGGGRILTANALAQRLFGYTAQELRGKPVPDLVPRRMRAGIEDARRRISHGGIRSERLEQVDHARHRDGGEFPAGFTIAYLGGDDPTWVLAVEDRTAFEQKELELRASDERAAALIEAAPDALVVVDDAGRIALVNARAVALFGYEREEMLGRTVEMLLPPAERRRHIGFRLAYTANPRTRPMGAAQDLEAWRKDGTRIPVEISLSPLRVATGLLVLAAVRDVSERALQRVALHRSEERLRALVDAVPDGVVVVDPNGVIQLVNAQTEQMFGYARSELVGRSVDVLVPDALADRHAGERAGYVASPQVRPMGPGRLPAGRRRDGSEFPIDVSLSPADTADGLVVIATVRDDSGRRWGMELAWEQERIRRLVESAPGALLVVDAEGRVRHASEHVLAMFGYEPGELAGHPVTELVPRSLGTPRGSPAPPDATDAPPGTEPRLLGQRRDGTRFPVDVSLVSLPGAVETLSIVSVQDVTESHRADQELRLAQVVRAEEQERLRIASDIHDDTIQAVVATSLRLERLRRRLTSDDQRDELARVDAVIQTAIRRLRHLVFELWPPELHQEGLISAVGVYLKQFETETSVHPTLAGSSMPEPPHWTRVALYRIVQELLTNVRKHAQARTVRVELGAEDGGFLVTVQDDGCGFQSESPDTRPGHIGLAALRERTRLIGGWCRFENGDTGGAVVRVWLPERGALREPTPGSACPPPARAAPESP